jgi:hypothetical protein
VIEKKPVIYLREENDVQGKDVYKVYSSPFHCEVGMHSMPLQKRNTKINFPVKTHKFNNTGYTSYDNSELKVGLTTPIK